jgi:polysaccharide export outer membrane protein
MLSWVVLFVLAQETGANLPARPIGADDLVTVSVYGSPELSRSVRVSADGGIRLPMLARPIEVAGLMPAAVETKIAEALVAAQILVDPAVTVVIAEYHSRPISVAGAVRRPLTFQVNQKTTLLEALTRAEGLNADAGTEILVTRSNVVERIAVKDLMSGSDPALNLTLEGGEVVRVPEMGRIFVVGNVRKPGAFRMEDAGGMTVLKALALAEGLSPFSAKEAYIYRRTDSNPAVAAQELPVGLRQLMDRKTADVALGPNDILYIPDSRRARNTANVIEKMVAFAAGTASGALILGVNR